MMFSVSDVIPKFRSLAVEIAAGLQAGNFSGWDMLTQKMSPLLEDDFTTAMENAIPGWRKIATLHDGQTAKHTLLVFAACLNLPEYERADAQTRTEVEWAAVLHDLDKERARQDIAHPFRSAAVVARIMPQLGFAPLPEVSASDLAAWSDLVLSAQRRDGERTVHDHSFLPQIMDGLHACWGRDTSAARVLKTVLLHQSLPTLKDWSNAVLLTDEELSYSLTLKDMDVLGTIIIADSDSWNIFDEPRQAYLAELRASNAETRRRIQGATP